MATDKQGVAPLIELGCIFARWIEENQPQLSSFASGFLRLAAQAGEYAMRMHSHFGARMDVYPELAKHVLPLAQSGWFISGYFGLSEVDQLATEAALGARQSDLEAMLITLYSENLRVHLEDIVREHPARAFAIRPAVDAHLRGEFALSVPIFFAQAEGVCFETASKYLFQGKADSRVNQVAREKLAALAATPGTNPIMGFYSLLDGIVWTSFSEQLPIAYNEKDRERFEYEGLNRNTILHGIAMQEYATEENSLKSFSLLSCIVALMSREHQAKTFPLDHDRSQ